ncbi:hypothetical protein [Streptococcus thermophilus]|uniref:hypothetical protein n=1 Tax=Streptococcus thermophilus TaxID=1308 RepID=UPI0038731BAA
MSTENCDNKSFGTIRNNTALKLSLIDILVFFRFGTIRNNTALKHRQYSDQRPRVLEPFETTQL